jgi:hypothetical protein
MKRKQENDDNLHHDVFYCGEQYSTLLYCTVLYCYGGGIFVLQAFYRAIISKVKYVHRKDQYVSHTY